MLFFVINKRKETKQEFFKKIQQNKKKEIQKLILNNDNASFYVWNLGFFASTIFCRKNVARAQVYSTFNFFPLKLLILWFVYLILIIWRSRPSVLLTSITCFRNLPSSAFFCLNSYRPLLLMLKINLSLIQFYLLHSPLIIVSVLQL